MQMGFGSGSERSTASTAARKPHPGAAVDYRLRLLHGGYRRRRHRLWHDPGEGTVSPQSRQHTGHPSRSRELVRHRRRGRQSQGAETAAAFAALRHSLVHRLRGRLDLYARVLRGCDRLEPSPGLWPGFQLLPGQRPGLGSFRPRLHKRVWDSVRPAAHLLQMGCLRAASGNAASLAASL